MKRIVLASAAALLVAGTACPVDADPLVQRVQSNDASRSLAGTWRSGSFQYTFGANGTYVYVGSMGGSAMTTQISEEGTYSVAGGMLTISRQRGLITNSQNYRQVLSPQTTTYGWRLGNTQTGPAMQLTFPNGKAQVFYRQ
jgi:hypothetical protein